MASELRPFLRIMPSDLTIVVADVTRMAAIRSGLLLQGRVVQFTNFNLSSALEAIKSDEPRVVAIDALMVQTQQGLGFIKRVESLAKTGCAIRLIVRGTRAWTTTEHDVAAAGGRGRRLAASQATPGRSAVVAARRLVPTPAALRRFPMLDSLNAGVEGGQASLVNISVLGAQVVSQAGAPAWSDRQDCAARQERDASSHRARRLVDVPPDQTGNGGVSRRCRVHRRRTGDARRLLPALRRREPAPLLLTRGSDAPDTNCSSPGLLISSDSPPLPDSPTPAAARL